jgi:hypothetical protein
VKVQTRIVFGVLGRKSSIGENRLSLHASFAHYCTHAARTLPARSIPIGMHAGSKHAGTPIGVGAGTQARLASHLISSLLVRLDGGP